MINILKTKIKKNSEIFALFVLIFLTVISTTYYNHSKKKIFNNFDLCLSSSKESSYYLKKLGAKNIKFFGNLKFSQSENEKIILNNNLKKLITSRRSWCASSTHDGEEKFCGLVHIELKKKYKNPPGSHLLYS